MIQFTLDVEPVAWERVKRDRHGRAYVPAKTRQFKRTVAWLARQHANGELLKGPLRLTAKFVLRRPGSVRRGLPHVRPDLDNFLKGLKDSLNGVIWIDDAQVCELLASKVYDLTPCPKPRIEILIEVLEQTKPDKGGQ